MNIGLIFFFKFAAASNEFSTRIDLGLLSFTPVFDIAI